MVSQDPMPTSSNTPKRTTILLSTTALSTSPHFLPLIDLLNETFRHSHAFKQPGKEYLPPNIGRFRDPSDMLDELGPDGFCLITFAEEEGSRIIATASGKPFKLSTAVVGSDAHPRLLFKRSASEKGSTDEGTQQQKDTFDPAGNNWEILVMAVDPTLQGQGIASTLMAAVIEEIKKCVASTVPSPSLSPPTTDSTAKASRGKGRKITLMLSTMRESNENYYLNRGWRTTGVKVFGRGTMGSRDGFSIAEMVRVVEG